MAEPSEGAAPAAAPAAPAATTAGADLLQSNYMLTAGAVILYSARALYVKFRNMNKA